MYIVKLNVDTYSTWDCLPLNICRWWENYVHGEQEGANHTLIEHVPKLKIPHVYVLHANHSVNPSINQINQSPAQGKERGEQREESRGRRLTVDWTYHRFESNIFVHVGRRKWDGLAEEEQVEEQDVSSITYCMSE